MIGCLLSCCAVRKFARFGMSKDRESKLLLIGRSLLNWATPDGDRDFGIIEYGNVCDTSFR